MRVAFIGGTHYVGPVTVPLLLEASHEAVVAHSGAHEHPSVADVEHLHGSRDELLAEGHVWQRRFYGCGTQPNPPTLAKGARVGQTTK